MAKLNLDVVVPRTIMVVEDGALRIDGARIPLVHQGALTQAGAETVLRLRQRAKEAEEQKKQADGLLVDLMRRGLPLESGNRILTLKEEGRDTVAWKDWVIDLLGKEEVAKLQAGRSKRSTWFTVKID